MFTNKDHYIKGYEIHELIGEGAFGAVYRAFQPSIGRDVVVKVMLPHLANDPDFIRRFETEARLIARLEHPYIVPLFDYWRNPDGAYLIMRWMRGGSLREQLKEGTFPPIQIGNILSQVADALHLAHRNGVIHRDIKPDNILLDEDGYAYLADFGIAKDFLEAGDVGETSEIVGTPAYLSPEQIEVSSENPVSPRSDIYALGIVIFELLTGQQPFHDTNNLMVLLAKQLSESVPLLSSVDPELPETLDLVIQRATAKAPLDRYPDAPSLARAFWNALPDSVTGAVDKNSEVSTAPIFIDTLKLNLGATDNLNPYKGLRPFEEADANDFFGREELVSNLIRQIDQPKPVGNFLAVIGPSGSGKSSVVKAGLIPKLRNGVLNGSDRWFYATMVPSADPFAELESALLSVAVGSPDDLHEQLRRDEKSLLMLLDGILPDKDSELFLTIDQFEELFTLVDDEATRAAFLRVLLVAVTNAKSRLRVVITLRADFYDRPLRYAGFGQLIRKRSEVVLPLSESEMRHAIILPAERMGMQVESTLVTAIITELSHQPGMLPLLQYALTEVFERKSGQQLTLQAYYDSGGVLGALARRAEEIYTTLALEERRATRHIYLRLVALGENAEDTRRRVSQKELLSIGDDVVVVQRVLDAFSKFRILTYDIDPATREPTVEIAHEALIREWKRLQGWINDNREAEHIRQRLSRASHDWVTAQRDESYLSSGIRLIQFEEWFADYNPALSDQEKAYYESSLEARNCKERIEAERQARELKYQQNAARRLQLLVIVFLMAAIVGLGLSLFALNEQSTAQSERDKALSANATSERRANESQSLSLAANARQVFQNGDRTMAITLALEATNLKQPPTIAQQVLAEVAYAPGGVREFRGHTSDVRAVDISPDGQMVLSGSADKSLILWDVVTGQIIHTFEGHTNFVNSVAFGPDGSQALSSSDDGTIILWDVETGEPLKIFEGHTSEVSDVEFSQDGRLAISGGDDNTVRIWDIETGAERSEWRGHSNPVRAVALSPNGRWVLSGSNDTITPLNLWEVNSGISTKLVGHTQPVNSVVFSPDNTKALSASVDETVIMWDVDPESPTFLEPIHTFATVNPVQSIVFGSDGDIIVAASDTDIYVWDVQSQDLLYTLTGHTEQIFAVAMAPDGRFAVSGAFDDTLRLWDIEQGAILQTIGSQHVSVKKVQFSLDSQYILSLTFENYLHLWNTHSGELVRLFDEAPSTLTDAELSPDERRIVTTSNDGHVRLWDIDQSELPFPLITHDTQLLCVSFSNDGESIFAGDRNGNILMWAVEDGTELMRFEGHTGRINDVTIHPTGSYLLSGSSDDTMILWDIQTGRQIRQFSGHGASILSADFSPDGQFALSGSSDNTMILWDVETGRLIRRFSGHSGAVTSVMFHPTEFIALSGSNDDTAILWDLDEGTMWRIFTGHRNRVTTVAFSQDGNMALSGSLAATNNLILWRVDSLEELIAWTVSNRLMSELDCTTREAYLIEPLCPTNNQ